MGPVASDFEPFESKMSPRASTVRGGLGLGVSRALGGPGVGAIRAYGLGFRA